MNLVAAGNTYNACLYMLKERGYMLWTEDLEDDRVLWCARRAEDTFTGYSPPELLGIVVLGEEYGEAWKRDLPSVIRDVLNRDAPDVGERE
jgi:hypothetical protein